MPATLINIKPEVLNRARQIFNRKVELSQIGTNKIPFPVCKKKGKKGEEITYFPFDDRHPTDLASFVIDTSSFPKDKKEELFTDAATELTRAFYTLDKNTDMPYPEAIKPYIKRMYENAERLLNNIDWDNAEYVAELLAADKASQSFATLVKDFPGIIYDIFPNVEDVRRIDAITGKLTTVLYELSLCCRQNPSPELVKANPAKAEALAVLSFEDTFEPEVVHPVFDARLKGSSTIMLDALASDKSINYFLKKDFEFTDDGITHNSDYYAQVYIDRLATAYKKTSIEQIPENALAQSRRQHSLHYDRMFINGRSITQIIGDIRKKKGEDCPMYVVEPIVGKMLRDALTDGKSIVTMMQVVTAKDGKTEFRHDEVKVDLDALNRVDKERTNYSRFRRFLDEKGIFKIRKYKTNEARDAAQAKMRNSKKFQKALRAAEDNMLIAYNSDEMRKKLEEDYPHMAEALPKFVRAEELEKNKQVEQQNPDRYPLPGLAQDLNSTAKVEPKPEIKDKTLEHGTKKF